MSLKSLLNWNFFDFLIAHNRERHTRYSKADQLRSWQSEMERTRTTW